MTKALVVEDGGFRQEELRPALDALVGAQNVDVAETIK